MLSLLTKNVFGRFMTQATANNNMMTLRTMATKTNKTAKLKGALKVKKISHLTDHNVLIILVGQAKKETC